VEFGWLQASLIGKVVNNFTDEEKSSTLSHREETAREPTRPG
jgi:hypothetical protein